MNDSNAEVTVRFDALIARIQCPHPEVDTETIIELAKRAMAEGEWQTMPAPFSFLHEADRPEFEVRIESFVEEIEDDDRDDAPEDFDTTLKWWQDLVGGNQPEQEQGNE